MAVEKGIKVARPDLFAGASGNGIAQNADGTTTFSPDALANLPGGAIQASLDYIVGGSRRKHRDFIVTAAGTAQVIGQPVDTFRTGLQENGTVWNSGNTFVKTEYHTSMDTGGKFPYSVTAVILAFELICIIHPAKVATVGSGNTMGQVTDAADNATQPTGYNPLAFLRAMLTQNRFAFKRGPKATEEEGLLIELPQTVGFSGFAGAATATLVQNTTFAPERVLLRRPKVIRPDEDFYIRLLALSALAQPVDFVAWFAFDAIESGEEGRV